MDQRTPILSGSEDYRPPSRSYQPAELPGSAYLESQTWQAGTQFQDEIPQRCSFALQSETEDQTTIDLQQQLEMYPTENDIEPNGFSSIIGDLAVDTPNPIFYVEDLDAEDTHEQHDRCEFDGDSYEHADLTAENDARFDDHRRSIPDEHWFDSHQFQTAAQNSVSKNCAGPVFVLPRYEPWNILAASRQVAAETHRPLHSYASPSSYRYSTGMLNHTEYSIPTMGREQTSNAYPELGHSGQTSNMTMGQPLQNPRASYSRRRSDISSPSLSPIRYSGYGDGRPMAITPPESRFEDAGMRDRYVN
jgi:hypothetical protein